MTAAEWLAAREPSPAGALAERVQRWVADQAGPDATEGFLASAEEQLHTLLGAGCRTRASALDLLAIDALVTYAFEAACDAPDTLDGRAARATERLSHVAVRTRG